MVEQTRPFTLRFDLCIFLIKENINKSFWLSLYMDILTHIELNYRLVPNFGPMPIHVNLNQF